MTIKKKVIYVFTIVMIAMVIAMFTSDVFNHYSDAHPQLSEQQRKTADRIAAEVADHWDEYGVLPSVAVAQAFVESSLGKNCSGYNLWGIKSGAVSYGSLTEGIHAYMDVINNGYYKGAPFKKNYKTQLRIILDGGYCEPEGDYWIAAMRGYSWYDFEKYDKKMFKDIKKKKEEERKRKAAEKARKIQAEKEKKWKKPFQIVYDTNVPYNVLATDKKVISGGVVYIMEGPERMETKFMMEARPGDTGGQMIMKTSNPDLVGTVYIEVDEKAVG